MPLTPDQLRELARAFPTRGASRHDPTGYEALRARIIEAIRPFAGGLDFDLETFEPLTQAELAEMPAHIFLVWCEDAEGMAYFYALPEADLNEGLAQAIVMLGGMSFKGPAELSPEQWGAALRLMAGVANPFARDAEDFHKTFVAVDGAPQDALPDLAEVESLFDQFAPCFVESAAGLSRRISRVVTIHRQA